MCVCVCVCVCSNIASDQMLFSEKDLEKSMDKIETINFHQVCTRVFVCVCKYLSVFSLSSHRRKLR